MIAELLIVGTLWFWVALLGIVILEIAAVEYDNGFAATSVAIAGLIGVTLFTSLNPFTYVANNIWTVLSGVVVYLAVGIAWGVIKWYFFVLGMADRYRDVRDGFLLRSGVDPRCQLDDRMRRALQVEVRMKLDGAGGFPPVALKNKSRIMTWMAYWPFSAVWTLVNDPVKRFYRFVYGRLVYRLQAISNHVFRHFESDFAD